MMNDKRKYDLIANIGDKLGNAHALLAILDKAHPGALRPDEEQAIKAVRDRLHKIAQQTLYEAS